MHRRLFVSASLLASIGAASLLQWPATAAVAEAAGGPRPSAERLDDGRWLVRDAAIAFGTTVAIAVVHPDRSHASAAAREAIAAMQRIDRLMSLHRADSQASRLNRDGRLREPDPHLLRVLEFSQSLAQASRGAFDITVQPLWELFAAAQARQRVPSAPEIAAARERVGWRHLTVSPELIAFDRPGMGVTFNGVAQGYAADLAMSVLRARGIADALIDSGEFGSLGRRRAGQPWAIGIAHPRRPGRMIATVSLDGRFVSTSGDYATAFSPDFRYHHIFDPATGVSAPAFSGVTVAARTGLEADGLSTALMVLDRADGDALRRRFAGCDALWIDKQTTTTASAGLPVRRQPAPDPIGPSA